MEGRVQWMSRNPDYGLTELCLQRDSNPGCKPRRPVLNQKSYPGSEKANKETKNVSGMAKS